MNDDKRLYNLDEIDYKVESDDPDVRGWEVKDNSERTVGEVDNLLVNKDTEKVVYLDVDVDDDLIEEGHQPLDEPADEGVHEFENSDGEDHLIVPIGMAHLNTDEEYVYSDDISYQTFANTKRFKKGEPIGSDYERYVVGHYGNEKPNEQNDSDFYNRGEFDRSKNKGW